MRFNDSTMLFEDLTLQEKQSLAEVCKEIVLNGKVPWDNELLNKWMEHFGYNTPDLKLLVVSTAFPQRALLSIVSQQTQIGNINN